MIHEVTQEKRKEVWRLFDSNKFNLMMVFLYVIFKFYDLFKSIQNN